MWKGIRDMTPFFYSLLSSRQVLARLHPPDFSIEIAWKATKTRLWRVVLNRLTLWQKDEG